MNGGGSHGGTGTDGLAEGEVSVHSTVEQEGSQGSQSSTSFTAVARPFLTVSVPVLPGTPVTASYARIGMGTGSFCLFTKCIPVPVKGLVPVLYGYRNRPSSCK